MALCKDTCLRHSKAALLLVGRVRKIQETQLHKEKEERGLGPLRDAQRSRWT